MLIREDNELLTRVGPGTAMGDYMRQYWLPLLLSSELEADGRKLRTKLLGEELVAFRDSNGNVGLLGEHCCHRGASLYFARNEECGLRCVYHGWKFDITGRCLDMPNEPEESSFKDKVRQVAYPCLERNGVIWTYMGPRQEPPPLPELEWNLVPLDNLFVYHALRECNWMQSLEGDIDSSHVYFLHSPLRADDPTALGLYHHDKRVHLQVVNTDYGLMYGARRTQNSDEYYWRITQMLLPIYTFVPLSGNVAGHCWVPMDDTHTMVWYLTYNPNGPIAEADTVSLRLRGIDEYLPFSPDPLQNFRLAGNRDNDYLYDPEAQRTSTFTGIPSIQLQDQAVTETMGAIFDRSAEHLGSTDAMIIQARRRLLTGALELRDQHATPAVVDSPHLYRVRPVELVLPKDSDWTEATREMVRA